MRYNDLYSLNEYLKNSFKVNYPIYLKRISIKKGLDGQCAFYDNKFVITIKNNLPEYYSIDVLLHEWSHVISWDKESDMHGLEWGKAYSRVYRKFLEWSNAN